MPKSLYTSLSGEVSGSIGDLGTFLPYIIGAISIGGMDATGVLCMFGLMYLFTAWFYAMPMPVQPMKVMGAAILVHHLTAGEVAASGLMMGFTLLVLAFTGWAEKLASITPESVTAGIQAGLGISLALLGFSLIKGDLGLGFIILILMLFLFGNQKLPVALIAVLGGTGLAFIIHPELVFPHLSWGIHLPNVVLPEVKDLSRGFTLAYLPQLPLTLTNSVLVTVALANQLYPDKSAQVTARNLCMTLGIGNLVTMPLGGFPICHGSGGLAAHYRFGGRTGLTPAIIGTILLLLGILLGPAGVELLGIIPKAVLGGLLFFSGMDLIRSIKLVRDDKSVYIFIVVILLSVAFNPGIAFVAGIALLYLLKKGLINI